MCGQIQRDHMVISMEAKEAFGTIQYSCITKALWEK